MTATMTPPTSAARGGPNAPNPAVPDALVRRLLVELYGLEGDCSPLSSERDQNVLVHSNGTSSHVLKIANANEDRRILELQNRALLLLAREDPDIPVPRLVRSRTGREIESVDHAGSRHAVRLLTAVPGISLSRMPPSPALMCAAGRTAARLDRVLRHLTGEIDHRLAWDVRNAPAARRVVALAGEERALLETVFDNFERIVRPGLAKLPHQWIHNDLNTNNLLAESASATELSGIIDFGDMVHMPVVVELAIVAAHQIVRDEDPVSAMREIVRAFDAVQPLERREIELLPHLVATRLGMAIVIQLAQAKEGGTTHFDLKAHGGFARTIARFAEFGWAACSDAMAGPLAARSAE